MDNGWATHNLQAQSKILNFERTNISAPITV